MRLSGVPMSNEKTRFVRFNTQFDTTIKLWGNKENILKTLREVFLFDKVSVETISKKFDDYDAELEINIKTEDDL
jgi:hypothetical protein